MNSSKTVLETWGITSEFLTKVVLRNPSLRGMLLGYIAEVKLWEIFEKDPRVSELRKDDDHDRSRKGDLVVTYDSTEFRLEVKSLQTNSIEVEDENGNWIKRIIKVGNKYTVNPQYSALRSIHLKQARFRGGVQCDASDRREIVIPGHGSLLTTCLLVGEFDILAAGLFTFREEWDFSFALNRDLPRSCHKNYPETARCMLIKSMVPVTWPLAPPFVSDPFSLMDRLIKERRKTECLTA